jgi:hypothetical protein
VDDARVFARVLHPAEIQSLFRCLSGAVDLDTPGGPAYFSPAAGMNVAIERLPGESSARVRNLGQDYAAAAFVLRRPGCALQSTRASDLGQDFRIEMDLRVGGTGAEPIAEAGPYFRSRRSAPGDGIIGGASAGFWVQLTSRGQVRVRRLHPIATIAFTDIPGGFDPDAFHRLAVNVRGSSLEASLDGRPLEFDQAGARVFQVNLPPAWETASPRGVNRGSAGVAFGCDANRGKIGGQEARNIRLSQ